MSESTATISWKVRGKDVELRARSDALPGLVPRRARGGGGGIAAKAIADATNWPSFSVAAVAAAASRTWRVEGSFWAVMRSGGDRCDCNRSRGTDIARGADPRDTVVRDEGGAVAWVAGTAVAAVAAVADAANESAAEDSAGGAASDATPGAIVGGGVAFSTPSDDEGGDTAAATPGTTADGAVSRGVDVAVAGVAAAIRAAIEVGADRAEVELASLLLPLLLLSLSPPSMPPLLLPWLLNQSDGDKQREALVAAAAAALDAARAQSLASSASS